jgi:hypothetical protein
MKTAEILGEFGGAETAQVAAQDPSTGCHSLHRSSQ